MVGQYNSPCSENMEIDCKYLLYTQIDLYLSYLPKLMSYIYSKLISLLNKLAPNEQWNKVVGKEFDLEHWLEL